MRTLRIGTLVTCFIAASGCTSQTADPNAAGARTGTTAPPPPMSQHPACIVSADCPAGEHCDLQQCTQDCNTADACTGQLTCSPRARCLAAEMVDADPQATGTYQGGLSASPASALLTDLDTTFSITLTSTSDQPVRYRVQVNGTYLSVAQPRGQFTGTIRIPIAVDTSTIMGQDAMGSVTVFTSLGTVTVNAPVHAGVTGTYKGKLSYDAGEIDLGESHLSLDILQNDLSVQIRVDSHDSMLFPTTSAGDTTGLGTYTVSDGIDATVGQVIDASFGGTANPFGRSIGRQVRFHLAADSLHNLSGTFDETIIGLFAEPITTSGHVTLQYVPQSAAPSFTVAAAPLMPTSPNKTDTADSGAVLGYPDTVCALGNDTSLVPVALEMSEKNFAAPLNASFQNGTSATAGVPFNEDIATACAEAMSLKSASAYQNDTNAQRCGLPQGLANTVQCGALYVSPSDATNAPIVARVTQEMLAAPLLVAKNAIVEGLKASFTSGLSAEQVQNGTAIAALQPYAAWVSQPVILEFLRSMSPAAAERTGSSQADGGAGNMSPPTFPAAQALADVFSTLAAVQGESARIDAAGGGDQTTALANAQQRAVLTYLEAATLSEILKEWAAAPASVGAKFAGMLNPLDKGFAALLEGANVFGVPAGFVPFVYDPANAASKGATNFEQMASIAANLVTNEGSLEMQFTANARAYDTEVAALAQEIQNVGTQFDASIQNICGSDFDPSKVMSASDWSSCGATGGTEATALEGIALAKAKAASDQALVQGTAAKIQIDVNALAQSQNVEAAAIAFTQANGMSLSVLDFTSGCLTAETQALQVASNASAMNLGAPAAEAAGVAIIGLMQASLSADRDSLQTAQTVNTEQTKMSTDYIEAMASIQKEQIDLAQQTLNQAQDTIAIIQAQLAAANLIDQAKELLQQRQGEVTVIDTDPTKDPSYRLLRDSEAIQVLAARDAAQADLYLAASALQYEVNMPIPALAGAVMNAASSVSMVSLQSCFLNIFNEARVAYGAPQDYITTVSVAQMLGITGPRTDAVTGQTLSAGDQFRQVLLQNQNLDGHGGVGITFATDLLPGNGLWADDVCGDRVASVQAQLVGDFLGDNEAQVNLSLGGGGVLRACDSDTLTTWSLGGSGANAPSAIAVVQAGVNTYGEAPVNTSLFGQPVARANWVLTIPGGQDAPANADVDITHLDDVVLRFDHKAVPRQSSPLSVDLSCLSNIGP